MPRTSSSIRALLIGVAGAAILAGCSLPEFLRSDDKPPLPGERISVLEMQKAIEPDDAALQAQGLVVPAPWRNEFWPQAGGYPNHAMQNLDLSTGALRRAWQADIGEGGQKNLPLTTAPIVVDGKVLAIDTDTKITAFDAASGKTLWSFSLANPNEDEEVIGGGMAFSGGTVYVTNGTNEIIALKPADGAILWRKPLPAPSRAAPTIMDNRVFVTALDNRMLALDAGDGTVLWEYAGLSGTAALVGAASPAASRDIVVPAFSSGEVTALHVENGAVAWSDNLSGTKTIGGLASLSDIRALPVIDKGLVVAISYGGRIAALDERSGARVWQREIGGANMPWLAGNHLFLISADNDLAALGRENGAIRWVTKLRRYEDENEHEGVITWAGPVFAGGRLIAAGSNGQIVEADPQTGKILRTWDASGAIHIAPIVAGGTLYLLHEDGTLAAYR